MDRPVHMFRAVVRGADRFPDIVFPPVESTPGLLRATFRAMWHWYN
jgi:hypothetical protein